jgi:hypothetical protein
MNILEFLTIAGLLFAIYGRVDEEIIPKFMSRTLLIMAMIMLIVTIIASIKGLHVPK